MRRMFVHHCLCGPQMNIVCGVKWQSETNGCPLCTRRNVDATKLFRAISLHSGAVRKRGLLSPHFTDSKY